MAFVRQPWDCEALPRLDRSGSTPAAESEFSEAPLNFDNEGSKEDLDGVEKQGDRQANDELAEVIGGSE